MWKWRFSESQIVVVLRGGKDSAPLVDLARQRGISRETCLSGRSKYGDVTVGRLKRTRELEAGNAKLKRMYAGPAVEAAANWDVLNGMVPMPLSGDRGSATSGGA